MTISMAYFTKRGKKIFYFLQKNAVWRRAGMKTVGVVRVAWGGKKMYLCRDVCCFCCKRHDIFGFTQMVKKGW